MPDRQKVIDGLQFVADWLGKGVGGKECRDALELLKEQEDERNPVIVCPYCGKRVK